MNNNFIGTWRTRDGSKVQVLRSSGPEFTGKVLEPYISPDGELWTEEGNHMYSKDLDLMERISEKDPRR